MTKNITLLSCLAFMAISSNLCAQNIMRSSLGMAGSSQQVHAKGHDYFVSQSIGQASITGTLSNNGHSIRQGFQQPPGALSVGSSKIGELKASVYPNPTNQWLNVALEENTSDQVNVILFDNLGRVVIDKTYIDESFIRIQLSNFTNGAYIIKVITANKQLTTTILKQ